MFPPGLIEGVRFRPDTRQVELWAFQGITSEGCGVRKSYKLDVLVKVETGECSLPPWFVHAVGREQPRVHRLQHLTCTSFWCLVLMAGSCGPLPSVSPCHTCHLNLPMGPDANRHASTGRKHLLNLISFLLGFIQEIFLCLVSFCVLFEVMTFSHALLCTFFT